VARLYEYQAKELLKKEGIDVPKGAVAGSGEEAASIADDLSCQLAIKAQVWTTDRASLGGIAFAGGKDEAREKAELILKKEFKGVAAQKVLVEEKLDIDREFYAGIIIDDTARRPVVLFSSVGGTGIEEIARRFPDKLAREEVVISDGFPEYRARELVRKTGISGPLVLKLGKLISSLYKVARKYEARAVEVNPLVLTGDGRLVAADCRITIDDYAVFRHPELGIDIAREFSRPASELERIAYKVEEGDYRGTFYFIQLAERFKRGDGYIGFHGAGGGGSMMSMDAVLREGFKLANFCDTSGNPPASKVYRAARIILAQGDIDGYFASGSGVASQEQFHSARGLVKAFREEWLSVPAVIRLGGNAEEKAMDILAKYTGDLPATIEGYGRDDTPEFCAKRLTELIKKGIPSSGKKPEVEPCSPSQASYSFKTLTGFIYIDYERCKNCKEKPCISACIPEILKLEEGLPGLAISEEEAARGKCIECLACELACQFSGEKGLFIELPIPGLEEYRRERSG
jgi:succinyl-CoA synthetase beta subunit